MTKPSHRIARPLAATVFAALIVAGDALAAGGELVLLPELPTLLLLIAFFVLLVYPMNQLLFKPIFAALDAREERIAGTRARAEKLAAEAERTLAQYESSVRGAREEADAARKTALAEAREGAQAQAQAARADADTEIERASGEIDAALGAARGTLRSEAQNLAREAAARVLGRSLS